MDELALAKMLLLDWPVQLGSCALEEVLDCRNKLLIVMIPEIHLSTPLLPSL
jgi:hypothetical protein